MSYLRNAGKEVKIEADAVKLIGIDNGGLSWKNTQNNLSVGGSSQANMTNGTNNTSVGFQSGQNLSSGIGNVTLGFQAGNNLTTASANTFIGTSTGLTCTGTNNTYLGFATGNSTTTGGQNIMIGSATGQNLTTGVGNIFVGGSAGQSITTTSNNICIGNAQTGVISDAGIIRIGVSGTHVKNFQAGITGITTDVAAVTCLVSSTGQLGTTSCNQEKKKNFAEIEDEHMKKLLHVAPVRSYQYRDGFQGLAVGPNLEDMEAVCSELYPDFIARDENGKAMGFATQYLPWMIVRDMQRMQREIDALKGVPSTYVPDYTLKMIVD